MNTYDRYERSVTHFSFMGILWMYKYIVMSPLFPTTAILAIPAEDPEGTTQDERKWVINLPTLQKTTRPGGVRFLLTDHLCVSRQRPQVKIDRTQSTP
ncbi:hypothetical protein AVEN_67762-1 [Araneus ventricosus]|uniref:Uncharacterized protein n=1 Tax=Araneus ventricosus TaxID=182803 RepID=A0A4Y2URF2_ARAVE|nr:hypothetical protein AVEN_67762-1 [Araneus ventricosus]